MPIISEVGVVSDFDHLHPFSVPLELGAPILKTLIFALSYLLIV